VNMAEVARHIAEMVEMLPEQEQKLAFELIKRMVLAWDNDFTRLTVSERDRLKKADEEILLGEIVEHSMLEWD
ncbi:MAG TPA: hypothetical protein VFD57_05855, partial [Clostridia bacterium]|nr:hypothetical protein [Clostridia bacterium]